MNAQKREEESSKSQVRYIERISAPSRVLLSTFGTQYLRLSKESKKESSKEFIMYCICD